MIPYHLLTRQIHDHIVNAACTATVQCKYDTLTLLGTLDCAFDDDTFHSENYSHYRGSIDQWISTHSGRTFVCHQKSVQVLQDPRFNQNSSLTEMIFDLIPAFKKAIYDRFGFVPVETEREQICSSAKVSRHHGQSKTRPMSLQTCMKLSITRTPTTGGRGYASVARK